VILFIINGFGRTGDCSTFCVGVLSILFFHSIKWRSIL